MAFDVSKLVDYAWSDIAKAAKTAMISAALGGATLRVNGRELGRISMADAKALYEFANQQMIDEQNPGDGGIILLVSGDSDDCGRRRGF